MVDCLQEGLGWTQESPANGCTGRLVKLRLQRAASVLSDASELEQRVSRLVLRRDEAHEATQRPQAEEQPNYGQHDVDDHKFS